MLNLEDQNHSQNSGPFMTSPQNRRSKMSLWSLITTITRRPTAPKSRFDGTKSLLVNRSMTFRTKVPPFRWPFVFDVVAKTKKRKLKFAKRYKCVEKLVTGVRGKTSLPSCLLHNSVFASKLASIEGMNWVT
jgi:hypothetical protein